MISYVILRGNSPLESHKNNNKYELYKYQKIGFSDSTNLRRGSI